VELHRHMACRSEPDIQEGTGIDPWVEREREIKLKQFTQEGFGFEACPEHMRPMSQLGH
jgi:hypothetical protein